MYLKTAQANYYVDYRSRSKVMKTNLDKCIKSRERHITEPQKRGFKILNTLYMESEDQKPVRKISNEGWMKYCTTIGSGRLCGGR